jgi:hypothetical protein
MDYQVDLDPTHRVIRLTVRTAVIDLEGAEHCYRTLSRLASSGGPYAAIFDLLRVTSTTPSSHAVRDFAHRAPSVPGGRTHVLVVKDSLIYGLGRMFEMSRDSGGQFHVVQSLKEAYEIIGVRPEDFTERLFPMELAA